MRRGWLAVLGVCVVAIGIAAWRLRGALDEPVVVTEGSAEPAEAPTPEKPTDRAPRVREPLPTGTATVRGTVRDEGKRAVAKARVCASRDSCVTSAADGTFTLANVKLPAASITASAMRMQPATEDVVSLVDGETRTIDFVLAKNAARVSGTVRDLGGAPIAGAYVSAAGTSGATSSSGAYELWVTPGRVDVSVDAEGFASATRSTNAPTTSDFALEPGGTIEGLVLDAHGEPVADAWLVAGTARASSSADGAFRISGLPARSYEVRARAFGAAGAASPVVVGLGQHVTGVVIRTGDAFRVAITVVRPDKTPCFEARASMLDERDGHGGDARTNAAGVLIVDGVLPGWYSLTVTCGDEWRTTESLDVRGDVDLALAMREEQTGTLRVTIEAPGRLATDSDALFLAIKGGGDSWRSIAVPANRIVVEPLAAGTYVFRVASASALESQEEVATISAGETIDRVVRIASPEKGRLQLLSVDQQGLAVGNIPVAITGAGVGDRLYTSSEGEASTYLPPGDYELSYRGAKAHARVVSGTTRDARIAIPPTATIRGVVVDRSGRAIAGASVLRIVQDGRLGSAATDASGAFQLPVTGEPPFALIATLRGGESPMIHTDGAGAVRLEIGGGSTLQGTLVTADGKPAPRFSVSLHDPERSISYPERVFSNGAFTWPNLAPGRYIVFASSEWISEWKTITLDVSANVALVLPQAYVVRGRLVDAVSNTPLADAVVSVPRMYQTRWDEYRQRSDPMKTDANGRFAITALVDGEYQLAITAGAGHLATNRTATVAGANLDLGDIAIARARK
jgi:hypothetical protein